jgi:hypothetical protein
VEKERSGYLNEKISFWDTVLACLDPDPDFHPDPDPPTQLNPEWDPKTLKKIYDNLPIVTQVEKVSNGRKQCCGFGSESGSVGSSCFWALLDLDLDPSVRCTELNPDPSIIKQK